MVVFCQAHLCGAFIQKTYSIPFAVFHAPLSTSLWGIYSENIRYTFRSLSCSIIAILQTISYLTTEADQNPILDI